MARITIEDLPVMEDLNAKQMKGIFGGEWWNLWTRDLVEGAAYVAFRLTDDSPEGEFDPLNKQHRNGRIGSPDE